MFGAEKPREFQQGMDQNSLRRAREEDRLSLRRKNREDLLQRKRRQIMSSSYYASNNNGNGSLSSINADNTISDRDLNSSQSQLASTDGINIQSIIVDNLPQYIQEIKSSNQRHKIHGTMCIRILLSKADNHPPYKQIMESGIVPILLQFFRFDQNYNEKLQFEASWAVTNLCSSTKEVCHYVCKKCNAIKAFEHLLNTTKHFEIMEQAVWGLGNIAGESQEYRNILIRDGIFRYLLENAEQFLKRKNYTLCRNAIWCLSNLVRYDGVGKVKKQQKNGNDVTEIPKDLPPWDKLKGMIVVFNKLLNEIGGKIKQLKIQINSGMLQNSDPEYVQCLQCCSDCLWTIHYTQCYMDLAPNSTYLTDIFQTNLIEIIILFMTMDSVVLLSPSLRIMGTFLSGEDEITEKILEKGYLKAAMLNLQCKVRMIRKEVCWTLSNIAGCEKEIAVKIIEYENGQLLKSLTNTCLYDDDQVKKEAGWVLANIISLSDPEIIHFMVGKGVIGALRAVMKTSSVKKPLITCMEAFDVIMSHTKSRDGGPYDYITKVEECGCLDIFDILQAGVDDSDKVYTTSAELVAKYWPENSGLPWEPSSAVLTTHLTTQDPQRVARVNGDDNNDQEDADEDDDDDDDDLVQPEQNGNQFGFGINHNHTNHGDNNNGDNHGNNNNGNSNNNNQPFQF